jgi:uncharacterized protein YggE
MKELIMVGSKTRMWVCQLGVRLSGIAIIAATAMSAPANQTWGQEAKSPPDRRVVVVGEGSVNVAADYAQITSGVSTRAKTVNEANSTNSKLMAAIYTALSESGITQTDIQTSQFSVEPVYAPQDGRTQPKLDGYSVSNQVTVKIHQIRKVGDILDRLISAGVTDVRNISFLVSDPSKALDAAREAAIADAQHSAEVYAHASGLQLGRVIWITEDSEYYPQAPTQSGGMPKRMAASIPIAVGENTLRARVTVGFDIDH